MKGSRSGCQATSGNESTPTASAKQEIAPSAGMSVLRMSKNDTWEKMKVQRKSSFGLASDDGDNNVKSTFIVEEGRSAEASTSSSKSAAAEKTKSRRSSLLRRGNGDDKRDIVCVVNDQSTILEAILSPDRLNALLACDEQVLSYDPTKWSIVLSPRGRNVRMIAIPLALLTLWGILWIGILSMDGMDDVRDSIASLEGLISPLLIPVSFLLVFRLGRAAIRFWDARKAIGKIVETCRVITSTAAVGCMNICNETIDDSSGDGDDGMMLLQDFARWTCAFPIAVKNFLRPGGMRKGWGKTAQDKKRRFEFGQLLSDEEAETVLNTGDENFATLVVLNKLRELAWKVATCGDMIPGKSCPRDMLYNQLNSQIDTLTGAWGACERINGTPLPLVYVVHLRTFLLLYLILWQLEAAANYGWPAIPTVFAASWGLLGIEAAAVECERPFQYHSNHLALGKMCVVASRNVAQTVKNVQAR